MGTRTERVVLTLDDAGFTTGLAKAAAAARALDRSLDDLDGSTVDVGKSTERTTKSTKEYTLEMAKAEERSSRLRKSLREQARAAIDAEQGIDRATAAVERQTTVVNRGGSEIDRLSGRMRIFADAAAVLGPSLIPIGAIAVPAVTGLASQLGFAAVAAGTAVFAFQGVGDALKAVNQAALEPTTANLEKAQAALNALGPAGQQLVARLQEIRPHMEALREVAQNNMFPGIIEGLDSLERLGPKVTLIVSEISSALGDIFASGADSLSGPRWEGFFDFLAGEARGTLTDLAATIGSVAHGLAEMWMAFQPLNNDFAGWLRDAARGFDEWAAGLSQTQGFQDFVAYLRENGPRVADAAAAIGNALVQIVQALAPLGGPSLKIIETFANAVAAIADSDMGTPILVGVAALAAYNRALAIAIGLQTRLNALGGVGAAGAKGKGTTVAPTVVPTGGKGAPLGGFGSTLALLGGMSGSAAMTGVGGRLDSGLGWDVNLGNSSPIHALQAIINRDADGFILSDLIKRIGGPDDDPGSGFGLSAAAPDFESMAELQERAAGTGRDAAAAQAQLAAALGNTQQEVATYNATMAAHTDAVLGAFSAETNYRMALKAAREQARTNQAGIKGMSDAAIGNRQALDGLASAWNNQSDAVRNNKREYEQARRQFIRAAVDMGVSEAAAARLANQMLKVPDKKTTTVDLKDLATAKFNAIQRLVNKYGLTEAQATALLKDAASGKMFTIQGLVNRFGVTEAEAAALLKDLASGKLRGVIALLAAADRDVESTITVRHREIYERYTVNGGRVAGTSNDPNKQPQNANGGFYAGGVRRFADGGFGMDGRYYPRVPQIVAGGANVLWGEEETGWEAYISGKPGMEDRNRRVLAMAADRLGMQVVDRVPVRTPNRIRVDVSAGFLSGRLTGDGMSADVRADLRAVIRDEVASYLDWDNIQEGR